MNIEKIQEPIRVLVVCGGGGMPRMSPLRFYWSGRTYKVDTVNACWIDRQGEGCPAAVFCRQRGGDPAVYSLHYSVQAGGQTYYLHFDAREVQWWLDQTIFE